MLNHISTKYEKHLDCVVVRFPKHVTESQIRKWKPEFLEVLIQNELVASDLLLDTNRHDFENINCLRLLHETLTGDPVVRQALTRVAFVQPLSVREPTVVSRQKHIFASSKMRSQHYRQVVFSILLRTAARSAESSVRTKRAFIAHT